MGKVGNLEGILELMRRFGLDSRLLRPLILEKNLIAKGEGLFLRRVQEKSAKG
jgi:hypothetical protein